MAVPPGQSVFRLLLTLERVTPVVWRRLLVPGNARLDKLHRMFQAAMGWQDYHLHCFEIGDARYGTQDEDADDDFPDDELDEKEMTILGAIVEEHRFVYEYDFGDSLDHEVVVEARSESPLGLKFGVCVDGENACPPEDCGGAGGYADLLAVLADPTHEEHEFMSSWVGGPFNPNEFDLALTNARLQSLR